MNKIERLIRELCPDGVTIKKLGVLENEGALKLGRGDVISKMDMAGNPGNYPVYSSSATDNGVFGHYGKYMFDDIRITWSIDGGGKFFYRELHKYSVTNVCGWLKVLDEKIVNPRYLYYVLISIWGARTYNYTVKAHPSVIKEDYFIPVPPIEIQNEIVSTLDTFAHLEIELKSELQLRSKQFSYYCDLLFSANYLKDFKKSNLGSEGVFIRGKGIQKTELLKSGIPAIHYGEIHTHYNSFTFDTKSYIDANNWNRTAHASHGDVILATTSESVEDVCKPVVWLGEKDIAVSGDATIYRHTLDPLFAAYFFQSNSFSMHKKRLANGSKVKRISGEKMKEVEILVPSPEVQKMIGEQLKLMEMLISDTNFGIPAELLARQQQYMYYRDKLLAFKELESA